MSVRFSASDNITHSTALVTALDNVTTLTPTTAQAINDTNITVPHKCLLLLYEDIGKSRWDGGNGTTVWPWARGRSLLSQSLVEKGLGLVPSLLDVEEQEKTCFIYFLQSPLLGSSAPGSQCAFLYVSSLEAALCQGQNPGHFQPNLHYILHTSEYHSVLLNWWVSVFFLLPLMNNITELVEREPRPDLAGIKYIFSWRCTTRSRQIFFFSLSEFCFSQILGPYLLDLSGFCSPVVIFFFFSFFLLLLLCCLGI